MREVKENLRIARRHRTLNSILMIMVMIMVAIVFGYVIAISRNVISVAQTATRNTTAIAEIKANQDLYRQQYLQYIKDLIATMNKLQEDNADPKLIQKRGVKVPKMPVIKTPIERTTEADLERIPQPAPVTTPTPIVKIQTKTKKVYIKTNPTPKPKTPLDWFKKVR